MSKLYTHPDGRKRAVMPGAHLAVHRCGETPSFQKKRQALYASGRHHILGESGARYQTSWWVNHPRSETEPVAIIRPLAGLGCRSRANVRLNWGGDGAIFSRRGGHHV